MAHMQTDASVFISRHPENMTGIMVHSLTDVETTTLSRQTGSAKSVYLPAGRQGGVVKGGGGGGGQEEAEPEQEHS